MQQGGCLFVYELLQTTPIPTMSALDERQLNSPLTIQTSTARKTLNSVPVSVNNNNEDGSIITPLHRVDRYIAGRPGDVNGYDGVQENGSPSKVRTETSPVDVHDIISDVKEVHGSRAPYSPSVQPGHVVHAASDITYRVNSPVHHVPHGGGGGGGGGGGLSHIQRSHASKSVEVGE